MIYDNLYKQVLQHINDIDDKKVPVLYMNNRTYINILHFNSFCHLLFQDASQQWIYFMEAL